MGVRAFGLCTVPLFAVVGALCAGGAALVTGVTGDTGCLLAGVGVLGGGDVSKPHDCGW